MFDSDIERPCWNGEFELGSGEGNFNQLFVSSAIGMALLDAKGRFLSANETLCEILGYTEKELRKMRCEELLNSFSQSECVGFLRSLDKTNATSWQTERTLCRKDQSLMPARIWISVLERSPLEELFRL